MKATLLVPYSYTDPAHDFDASDEIVMETQPEAWQRSINNYENRMIKEWQKYMPMIKSRIRSQYDIGTNLANNDYGAKEKTNYRREGVYFNSTMAKVNNIENHDMTIDELIGYYKSGDMFLIDLQLPVYDHNEDLEPEVNQWIIETLKINRAKDLDDEERMKGYTKRDMKLKFDGSKSSALLKNTRLIDVVNNHTFCFLVEQIIFLKE